METQLADISVENNPALLDDFKIMGLNAIEVRIALGLELYIAPGDSQAIYQGLLATVEDYYQRFSNKLNCYALPNSTRVSKIKKDPIPIWRKAVANLDLDYGMDLSIFYDDTHQGVSFNATPWQYCCLGPSPDEKHLAGIQAMMSIGTDDGNLNFSTLLQMTLAWCKMVKPIHGLAGFCFAYTPDAEVDARHAYALMKRFPGINQIELVDFVIEVKNIYNRIKGANWLTVLGNPLVTELGGQDRIRKELEPECQIHDYGEGIIIVAGPMPQLGDSYTGFIPTRYQKVAQLTKPIRLDNYRSSLFRAPEPLDGIQETLKWVRRFD